MGDKERGEGIEQRSISFYGEGVSTLIEKGIKLATMRWPSSKYSGFEPGERVLADCSQDEVNIPIVILNSEEKPINDFTVPELSLDGFFSHQEAAEGLNPYYPGKDITPSSPMRYLTFLSEKYFNGLLPVMQRDLIEYPTEELIKDKSNRPIFFPSICQWMVWRKEIEKETGKRVRSEAVGKKWLGFLAENDLVDPNELEILRQRRGDVINRISPSKLQEVLEHGGDNFSKLGILYQEVVLCKVREG